MLQQEMRQWYVVYSKPRKEEFAEFHLRKKGLEVFFPRLHLPGALPKRKQVVPLFPNYLFVKIHVLSEEYHYVNWSPGVKRLVSFNSFPVPLNEDVVAFLMDQSTSEGTIAARSNLMPGQEVEINGGPFDGLIGIIQNPPDAKGRVKLLLNLLSREVKVAVPLQFIDSGWVVAGGKEAHRIRPSVA